MKKLTAIILALMLLLSLSMTAAADDDAPMKALSWITARRAISQAGLDGAFYQIGSRDCDIWVPDILQPQEDIPEYSYCAFAPENNAVSVTVNHLSFDGEPELEELEEIVPEWGGVSDGIFWINNLYALIYETEEEDSLSALILTTDGDGIEFVFTPISNPDFYSLTSLMLSTIQRHQLDSSEMALMIDADLNNMWGPNRSVRIAETDEGEMIRVFLWDDGVTSETIQTTKNWDAVREDKIAIYNSYAGALEEFGFENLSLELLYISPEEDLSFLTIADGEIIYDVFDEAA